MSLRILLVSGIFPPDNGGPASYVPAIAMALAKRGHVIEAIVTLSDSLAHEDSGFGFPVLRIRRGLAKLFRFPLTVAAIWRRARGADVVFLNGLVFEGIVACKLLRRKPVVVKVVGDFVWERARTANVYTGDLDTFSTERLSARWRLLRTAHSWCIRRADLILTPSRYLAGIVGRWRVPTARIRVVYNAIEEAQLMQSLRRDGDVVTVARLVAWKGIDALIELSAQMGWSLKVVGDGPLRRQLQEQVDRLGAAGRITLIGQVPHEQVAREISSSKVFVLNSSYEGLPHIVLEAKMSSTPVIATSVGGTPEAVQDGIDGFLVAYGDVEQLRRRIGQLLADAQLRARLGVAGQEDVRRRFSFCAMVQATEEVLRECSV